MFDSILVPTDGSDHTRRAAEHAGRLGREFGATVHLLGVVDVQAAAGPFGAGGVDSEFIGRLETATDSWLDTADQSAGNVPTTREMVKGVPYTAILEYTDDHDIDLVVMGTHSLSGVRRYLAGSTTEQVVQRASVPVLVTHASDPVLETAYEDVLLATDGSPPADQAVEFGLDLAGATGARVHGVSLVDLGPVAIGAEDAPVVEFQEYLRAEAERAVNEVAEQSEARGIEAVTVVRDGSPVNGLLSYAEENDTDLIVVGTHGRRGIERMLLGSTTQRLLRRAEAPILVIGASNRDE
jgi:nucleotide-binding universal stress UspA family protein